ncbi:hypothetical protein G6O69_19440 [Pseudenhygromyxa sp. WMMC2535]|uniref:hypothetical protein n=1 Tax=Pseudenhygromyxa sp. WMMC2535 TaxID=2712867 RepID=UPI0015551AB2|nr:hypothetical protein [Pseudenhygromyxa sp. WMMC2535]NVB40028.1 hypothetical protein [Pseudenhygromyxa sp. WMMC2535]
MASLSIARAPRLLQGPLVAALALVATVTASACADEDSPHAELVWEICDHGQRFVDGECMGPATLATWGSAIDGCASMISEDAGSRWRLPTPAELEYFVRADPEVDSARRWSNARDEEDDEPLAVDHGGYPRGQVPGKRLRYRCVKD